MDIRELNIYSMILRTALSIFIGGALGIERGRKNRPAGMRTHMLVCLGSALVMMTNQYAVQTTAATDPVRMGAQVISGIGFLGAGTIIVTGKSQVKGITTAAGLWTAACCGLAIGIGFYEGAIVGGVAIFMIMAVMHSFDAVIKSHSKIMDLYIEFDGSHLFSEFIRYTREKSIDVFDVQLQKNSLSGEGSGMFVSVSSKVKRQHNDVLQILTEGPGVLYVEEV